MRAYQLWILLLNEIPYNLLISNISYNSQLPHLLGTNQDFDGPIRIPLCYQAQSFPPEFQMPGPFHLALQR